jgi:tetratricopeptide (TPR) repeat protein
LVRDSLTVSPRSPIAHYAFGQVLRASRRNEQCIPEYQEALAFNHSWADALAGLGWCKFWVGLLDEAIALHEQAVRLSPRDPQIGYWYFRIGLVRLLQSRIQEAIPWLEKGRSAIPTFPLAYSFLGAAYALNGETERGAAELAETYRLSGKVWVSTLADMKVTGYWDHRRSALCTNPFISSACANSACRTSEHEPGVGCPRPREVSRARRCLRRRRGSEISRRNWP